MFNFKTMKKIVTIFLGFISLFFFFNFASAQIDLNDEKIDIDLFYSKTCPHCEDERDFLRELSLQDPNISIDQIEITQKGAVELLNSYFEEYNVPEEQRMGVPITFIEDFYFVGFSEELGKNLEAVLSSSEGEINLPDGEISSLEQVKNTINIPFINNLISEDTSPFLLAVIFGGLDGFNACAMAALAFLIAVLIGTGSRKKLILIGLVFIFISGLIYYLFMTAWLNIILVLPNLEFITILIGLVTIVFGVFVLKDYFNNVICKLCEVSSEKQSWFSKKQQQLMLKMKSVIDSDMPLILMLGGVAIVAAGINLIELVCSFGLPVAFTKILTAHSLSGFDYYLYLMVYVFFYMLDDLIIFLIAVFTLNLVDSSGKYIKIAKLLSGILLLALGIIMIFFPDVLGMV